MVSAFTYIHNALNGGYPLFEAIAAVYPYVGEVVVLDLGSDDGTGELLEKVANNPNIQIVHTPWEPVVGPSLLGDALAQHSVLCRCNVVVHFEADEVYSDSLICEIAKRLDLGLDDFTVPRIQLTQNFQRARWWTTFCHRIYPKGSVTKRGHTTEEHGRAEAISPDVGLLWDITNCFRDNVRGRMEQQSELWGEQSYHLEPLHASESWDITKEQWLEEMKDERWKWTRSPFDLPKVLRPLVGQISYEPDQGLISDLASGNYRAIRERVSG